MLEKIHPPLGKAHMGKPVILGEATQATKPVAIENSCYIIAPLFGEAEKTHWETQESIAARFIERFCLRALLRAGKQSGSQFSIPFM